MTYSEQLLDKTEHVPFIGSGVDDSDHDECSQRFDSTHQGQGPWSMPSKACATCIASLVLIVLCVFTGIVLGRLGQSASSVLVATTSSAVTGSATKTTSGLAATISCGRHPTLKQLRDEECIFDPMLLAWMPKPCVNFALLHAALNTTSELSLPPYEIGGSVTRQVYADPELTQQLPIEETRQMKQHPFYVTLRFHRAHCAYMFRLLAEAAGQKATLDGNVDPNAGVYGSGTIDNTGDALGDTDGPRGVYVWHEAVRPMHVDHCIKVLAWRGGDLDASEKFYGSSGRCVLL